MSAQRLFALTSHKKPRTARLFLLLVALLQVVEVASAEETGTPLTERDAVQQALERASLTDVIEGQIAVEKGRGRALSAYPNLQLSYLREQTFGAFGTGEDYLSLAQTIDLGNRHGLHGQAAERRVLAAEKEGEAWRLAIAAEARLRFFEVVYRQSRVVALEDWAARIVDALEVVTHREDRGDAATYDRRRLERELAVAKGRLESELGTLERAQARLGALLRPAAAAQRVAGALLPEADPATLPALRAAIGARSDLQASDLRIEAALLDRTRASRWHLPDLRLEAGWKGVDLGPQGRTDGFLFGASLPIPLWDQSSGQSLVAEGEAQTARGRRTLLELELRGEVDGARAEAVRLRRAASEFRSRTMQASADLVHIAVAGYEGGELGLLELLDAYRGAAEDSLNSLDMEHAARRARIDLDRLTGAGVP